MDEPESIMKQGKAYARLVEAAEVLLAGELDEAEQVLLEQMRQVYKRKLRALVASQPSAVMAQILAVSESIHAPAGEFGKN